MISKPTVLVLGAGASADYGFRTGFQLLQQIFSDTKPNGKLQLFLRDEMTLPEAEIYRFNTALGKSQAPSVDSFLEYRREFEQIGKLAIAATLIPFEDGEKFILDKPQGWYSYLFGLMIQGGRFEDNPLSVVTFNYDRSLEAFFLLALCNLYGIQESDAEQYLKRIPIIHLHGSLGDKLWKPPLASYRAYQPDLTPAWVMEAANHIKIIHEVNPGGEFDNAMKLLYQAAEVIFLGFGFLPDNVRRLGLAQVAKWREMDRRDPGNWFACPIGMGDGDVARVRSSLTVDIQFAVFRPRNITEYLKNTRCLMVSTPEAWFLLAGVEV